MTEKEQYIAFIRNRGDCSVVHSNYHKRRFCDVCVLRGTLCDDTHEYPNYTKRYNMVLDLARAKYGEDFLFDVLL